MDMEELRRVLRLVCSKQPSFVLDILDTVGVMVQSNQGLKEGLHQAGVSALMPEYADRPGRSTLWQIQRELSIKATSKYAII